MSVGRLFVLFFEQLQRDFRRRRAAGPIPGDGFEQSRGQLGVASQAILQLVILLRDTPGRLRIEVRHGIQLGRHAVTRQSRFVQPGRVLAAG